MSEHHKIETTLYSSEKIIAEMDISKNEAGDITDWVFKINNVEEMSMGSSIDYEYAFVSLLAPVLSKDLSLRHKVNWLTVGGADYQLAKFYKRNNVNNLSQNSYVLVDPLAGKLRDLFSLVDPVISKVPFAREINLKFSDFMLDASDEFLFSFDIAIVDVSDSQNDTFLAPDEIYTTKFLEELTMLMKLDSYVIMYEGENFMLDANEKDKIDIKVPKWFHLLSRKKAGYGYMSLWKVGDGISYP